MSESPTRSVLREARDGVLLLTLNRPRRKNAFDGAQWTAFADSLADALRDDTVAAVVLTGAGDDFSAGADLTDTSLWSGSNGAEGAAHPFDRCMQTLAAFDKPLLAAVRGVGVGIGATLPLHCDVVYLGEGARLRFPFSTLGLVPEAASSVLLPRAVGAQRAAEILFTSEWIDAPRALELGLAARVLPDDEVLAATLERAGQIACMPVGALRAIKRLLLAGRDADVRAALRREMESMRTQVGTPENREAMRAFAEKRPPDFRGLRRRS